MVSPSSSRSTSPSGSSGSLTMCSTRNSSPLLVGNTLEEFIVSIPADGQPEKLKQHAEKFRALLEAEFGNETSKHACNISFCSLKESHLFTRERAETLCKVVYIIHEEGKLTEAEVKKALAARDLISSIGTGRGEDVKMQVTAFIDLIKKHFDDDIAKRICRMFKPSWDGILFTQELAQKMYKAARIIKDEWKSISDEDVERILAFQNFISTVFQKQQDVEEIAAPYEAFQKLLDRQFGQDIRARVCNICGLQDEASFSADGAQKAHLAARIIKEEGIISDGDLRNRLNLLEFISTIQAGTNEEMAEQMLTFKRYLIDQFGDAISTYACQKTFAPKDKTPLNPARARKIYKVAQMMRIVENSMSNDEAICRKLEFHKTIPFIENVKNIPRDIEKNGITSISDFRLLAEHEKIKKRILEIHQKKLECAWTVGNINLTRDELLLLVNFGYYSVNKDKRTSHSDIKWERENKKNFAIGVEKEDEAKVKAEADRKREEIAKRAAEGKEKKAALPQNKPKDVANSAVLKTGAAEKKEARKKEREEKKKDKVANDPKANMIFKACYINEAVVEEAGIFWSHPVHLTIWPVHEDQKTKAPDVVDETAQIGFRHETNKRQYRHPAPKEYTTDCIANFEEREQSACIDPDCRSYSERFCTHWDTNVHVSVFLPEPPPFIRLEEVD